MLSKKLLTIASLIKKDAIVLDVGTDHAYLPIYLKKNNLCKEVYASDISKGALEIARKNILKNEASIKLIESDGLKSINELYDTLVIAGMGTYTIIKILESGRLPNNIILSSNNDLEILRRYMLHINYKIIKEVVICENSKYYDIISYQKGKDKLTNLQIKYGKSKNKEYFNFLYTRHKLNYKKMNLKNKILNIKKLVELRIISN